MKAIRCCVVVLFLFAAVSPSFAALSKQYADFAKGPAEYLMTKEERKQWKAIATDDQAKAFIDLFWARRDPTPGTAQNEFKMDVDERIKVADSRFHTNYGEGSKSDRGKVFILMGSPTKIRKSGSGPQSTIQLPAGRPTGRPIDMTGGQQNYSPKELWEYAQGKTPIDLGQPLVQIAFIDQYGTDDWKMDRSPQSDLVTIFESVAQSYIAQPDLKSVPVFDTPKPAAAAVVTAPAPMDTELKTDAFRTAVEQARAASKPPENLFVSYGEFITPKGEHFVPVQIYVPKSAGLAANTPVTFFGSVEKEGGEKAAAFEEPATLSATTDGVFVARSLQLLPGSYRASFGIAKDGKPVAVTTVPITVAGLDKDAPGVSSLILTNNIYPLSEAQQPTDPFAFGGLQVVPKSDSAFRKTEDLTYFFELRNPGVDPATSQPKVMLKMSVTGTTADGKNVKMSGAPQDAPLQELKGVPGHFAVGAALPLAKFNPGNYTLSIKVTDVALNKTYDLSSNFRIVE
ncbi:MAG TPA: GWxTD domain-containing protein [Thermoanaerobaculia bacterium]|nr:GWxTD domain-containing protein [Thermoanaerobaculia bacterium]